MLIRYAIWAAVSTRPQAAANKLSLPDQVELTRAAARAQGWQESADPYIVAGQSRTRYVDLSVAERDIPALHAMLDDAQAGRFDVLAMYDLDRMRDLLDLVALSLDNYRIQLYSVSQPVEIQPPEKYTPYSSDSSIIIHSVYKGMQRAKLSALRRYYTANMPARITSKGLPPSIIPYGYRKPPGRELDKNAVPEQDPLRAPWVLKIKDWFLGGKSSTWIADALNKAGVSPARSSRWNPSSVIVLLYNPFYSGMVRFGQNRYTFDTRTRTERSLPSPNVVSARGKHLPLWDDATHQAILREFQSRNTRNWHGPSTHNFTKLLVCGVCAAPLYHDTNGPRHARLVWRCRNSTRATRGEHASFPDAELEALIAAELFTALQDAAQLPRPAPAENGRAAIEAQLAEVDLIRARLEAGYEGGLYTLERFSAKVSELDKQRQALQLQLSEYERAATNRGEFLAALGGVAMLRDHLSDWLRAADPVGVNRTLHILIDSIVVGLDGKITINFK